MVIAGIGSVVLGEGAFVADDEERVVANGLVVEKNFAGSGERVGKGSRAGHGREAHPPELLTGSVEGTKEGVGGRAGFDGEKCGVGIAGGHRLEDEESLETRSGEDGPANRGGRERGVRKNGESGGGGVIAESRGDGCAAGLFGRDGEFAVFFDELGDGRVDGPTGVRSREASTVSEGEAGPIGDERGERGGSDGDGERVGLCAKGGRGERGQ